MKKIIINNKQYLYSKFNNIENYLYITWSKYSNINFNFYKFTGNIEYICKQILYELSIYNIKNAFEYINNNIEIKNYIVNKFNYIYIDEMEEISSQYLDFILFLTQNCQNFIGNYNPEQRLNNKNNISIELLFNFCEFIQYPKLNYFTKENIFKNEKEEYKDIINKCKIGDIIIFNTNKNIKDFLTYTNSKKYLFIQDIDFLFQSDIKKIKKIIYDEYYNNKNQFSEIISEIIDKYNFNLIYKKYFNIFNSIYEFLYFNISDYIILTNKFTGKNLYGNNHFISGKIPNYYFKPNSYFSYNLEIFIK